MLNPFVRRWVIKDPLAAMASEFLHRECSMETVVLVRHPAAFVASIRRLNWPVPLDRFSSQPDLMRDYVQPCFEKWKPATLNMVGQAAFMWLLIYRVLAQFLDRNPHMIAVRHEDLSSEPTAGFRRLYELLSLPYSHSIERQIRKFTDPSNPTEPTGNRLHVLRRDSVANIKRWKNPLSQVEVENIRRIVEPLACRFYSSDDW